jgi:hypothetical protein
VRIVRTMMTGSRISNRTRVRLLSPLDSMGGLISEMNELSAPGRLHIIEPGASDCVRSYWVSPKKVSVNGIPGIPVWYTGTYVITWYGMV